MPLIIPASPPISDGTRWEFPAHGGQEAGGTLRQFFHGGKTVSEPSMELVFLWPDSPGSLRVKAVTKGVSSRVSSSPRFKIQRLALSPDAPRLIASFTPLRIFRPVILGSALIKQSRKLKLGRKERKG